jgi:alkaline phosphatase D
MKNSLKGKIFDRWNRRRVIKGLGAGTLASLLPSCASLTNERRYFVHGVASGDPLQDRVIIWTRVTTAEAGSIAVQWQFAEDPAFLAVASSGKFYTSADADFTVKIDVPNLSAGQEYYYRFRYGGEYSVTGRTKTLPVGAVDSVSMAVVSCSNYPAGYFNVYDAISRLANIDVVVHLGDYIYEYGADGYDTQFAEELHRVPDPVHEIVTLSDYRTRYAQYRSDRSLQAMHARFPMIAVWDDHEFANDAWQDGAENHGPGEGDWRERKQVAGQAYREWLPVRELANCDGIYRSFDFGDLASLIMLDTRVAGRDPSPVFQPPVDADGSLDLGSASEFGDRFRTEVLNDPTREMLGTEQSQWLRSTLHESSDSGKPWQVLGQQVIIGNVMAPNLTGIVSGESLAGVSPGLRNIIEGVTIYSEFGLPISLDSWDGYPAARERLFADLLRYANNCVVLSGDSHSAGAFDLLDHHGRQAGVDIAVTSVTASGLGFYLPEKSREELHGRFYDGNENMRYLNVYDKGFCVLHLSKELATCEWHIVDTISSETYAVSVDKKAVVSRSGAPGTSALEIETG